MMLSWIRTTGFRNLVPGKIQLAEGVNAFIGANAQGKTNLLEAVALLASGRSFRGARIGDMLATGQTDAAVEGLAGKMTGEVNLKIVMNRTVRNYFIESKQVSDLRDFLGLFSYVVFSAESMAIVDGDPAARRNFLDHGVFSTHPHYLLTLRAFRRVLKSRNAVIKKSPENIDLIQSWDEPLCRHGAMVVHSRIVYLNKIIPEVRAAHGRLSGNRESLDLSYCSGWLQDEDIESGDIRDIEQTLKDVLQKELQSDIRRGATMSGPHRDELRILIDRHDIRSFGSRGQKRTALMALKLAELNVFYASKSEYPVFIIDDMASELDDRRQENLIEAIPDDIQILISHTGKLNSRFERPVHYFSVLDGQVAGCG